MPKRKDIKSILIVGAGPIIIGQACEFDYSGTQACKALREEGYRVILINSNPATIMTDPDTADVVYIEPITPKIVAKIIKKEKPDVLLPTMGGQTALNIAIELSKDGTLKKFEEGISSLVEVVDCWLVTGNRDYLLRVVAENLKTYEKFMREDLTKIKGIASIETNFALGSVKTQQPLTIK